MYGRVGAESAIHKYVHLNTLYCVCTPDCTNTSASTERYATPLREKLFLLVGQMILAGIQYFNLMDLKKRKCSENSFTSVVLIVNLYQFHL